MKIHREYEQGSEAWFRARAEIPTASEFSNLVTPKGKIKEGQGPASYLAEKLAQKWIGGPLPQSSSFAMEQGSIREEKAIPWYSAWFEVAVEKVGFCTSDDDLVGCSPDGLIGEDGGIEVKCPQAQTHVKYLLEGVVPDDYVIQVQGALFVTQRPKWVFLSFCPKFPALVLEVTPDPDLQDAIAGALATFLTRLDSGWKRLCEINGGPPPPKPAPATDRPKFSWEQQTDENDVPT